MLLALLGMLTALVNAHMRWAALAQAFRTAFTMALLAPIMAALFMFFPRMAPLWGIPEIRWSGRTGLSGIHASGHDCRTCAQRCGRFSASSSTTRRSRSLPSSLYFRGPVLSAFDGREMESRAILCEDSSRAARRPARQPEGVRPALRYEVTLEPHKRPLADGAGIHPQRPRSCPATPTYMTQDLQWMTTRPVTDVVRYRAESYPEFRHGPTASVRQLREFTAPAARLQPAHRWPWQRKCVPTLPWRGDDTAALVEAAMARLVHRRLVPTRWSLGCTASTRPMSSGLTANRAFANTLPPLSWC